MAKQKITYAPQILDLTLYAGDGAGFRLVVTDSLDNPVPLTGVMIAQIRKTREEADPPDAEFNIDLAEATDGIAIVTLTGDQTDDLAPDTRYSGVWDVQWTPTDSEPMTLCQGTVECLPDVSH